MFEARSHRWNYFSFVKVALLVRSLLLSFLLSLTAIYITPDLVSKAVNDEAFLPVYFPNGITWSIADRMYTRFVRPCFTMHPYSSLEPLRFRLYVVRYTIGRLASSMKQSASKPRFESSPQSFPKISRNICDRLSYHGDSALEPDAWQNS